MSHHRNPGFTLVELLIVVIILGILAAIVIPQFSSAASEAKESSIASSLRSIRESLELYRLQHNESYPDDEFVAQLTAGTDVTGAAGSDFGPYFRDPFPLNPVNLNSEVRIKSSMPSDPEGSEGWIYAKDNGDFRANVSGAAPSGTNWFDL